MSYADKTEKNFSARFSPRQRAAEMASPRSGMAKGRIAHEATLPHFLIFCKELLAEPFRVAASTQKPL